MAAEAPTRPWKAHMQWAITNLQWAGEPFSGVKSLFDGRCSLPSDYIVTGKFEGEATHAGRITGQTSHCTQITWTPQGPGGVAYSDGQGTIAVANRSSLTLTYGNGTSGLNAATGEFWFKDDFVFTGGTGRFEGATGGGEEGGTFKDFMALLAGAPTPMTMEGTIAYGRGNR